MVRSVIGFAVFAGIGLLLLKFVFGLLGGIFSIIGALLWFAAIGFLFYLILKVFAPETADRVREVITGKPSA